MLCNINIRIALDDVSKALFVEYLLNSFHFSAADLHHSLVSVWLDSHSSAVFQYFSKHLNLTQSNF